MTARKKKSESPGGPVVRPSIQEVHVTPEELKQYQDSGKLVGYNPKKGIAKVILSVLAAVLIATPAFATVSSSDEAVLGNNRWSVQSDGDLVPGADSSYDVGASGAEVDNVYADSLWLGGVEITGVSQISTPMEDAGTYTRPIDAADNIKLFDNGNVTITGTIDADGLTMENDATLTNAVNNSIVFTENSDTLTLQATGNDWSVDSSDGGIIFALTDATDGTVDFMTNNDTDDYIQISTSTNQSLINFVGQNGKITAASGTIDFDNENLTTTGTVSSGATMVTSLVIGDDVTDVVVDDVLRFASNDEASTIEAYGFEAKDGIVKLTADQSDDNGDEWDLISNQADNTFTIENDTSGTMAAKLTIAAVTGNVTLTGDVVNENADTLVMSTDDTISFQSNDEASRIQALGFEAKEAQLVLAADQSDDATDGWEIAASTTGTLTIGNDSSVAGTFVDKFTFSDGDIVMAGTTPTLTVGDAGEEDTAVTFDGAAADFSIGIDDTNDSLSISLGSALGTTEVLRADGTDITVTDNIIANGEVDASSATFLRVPVTTVAALPAAAAGNQGAIAVVTDADGATDCTVGSAATVNVCFSDGTAWADLT